MSDAPIIADLTAPERDTIFAPASGSARAGVSVMRISGPDAHKAVGALLKSKLPKPRQASLRRLIDPEAGTVLDEALVLLFNGPNSFTGEDVAELHLHGSPAVVEAVASALYRQGLRMAEPGEFTRRAFENGRMDLTEAEGLADLIDAETDRQRRQALRQMQGGLRQTYESWRDELLDALAMIEGEIDFPDEEDVPDALAHKAVPIIKPLEKALQRALDEAGRGEVIRHGLDIAIIGPPNAGKSTLINGISHKEAAIVSPIAGTTRDIIETGLEIAGLPVRLSDTAGIRESEDQIEAEGIRRAQARADQADLRIGVVDISDTNADAQRLLSLLETGDLLILNKADLVVEANVSRETSSLGVFTLETSLQNADGIELVRSWLDETIRSRFSMTESAGLTRARHRDCVMRALSCLERAEQSLSIAPELAGEDLRQALTALQELSGDADIEMVLDRIFSRFCIGK